MIDTKAFKEFGQNIVIHEPVTLVKPEVIAFKSHIIISEYVHIIGGLGLCVGNYIHISAYSSISGGGYCVLDDFVGLSNGVRLITGSEDVMGAGLTNPTIPRKYRSFYRSFIHCKKHSFLATNVIVLPGVTIGEGAVVGGGSTVTKDVEPWSVYIGSPAKKVKDRPKDKILEFEKQLLKEYNVVPSNFSDIVGKFSKKIIC